MKIALIFFSILFFLAVLLFFCFVPSPSFAGTTMIQGQKVYCPDTTVRIDNQLDNLGETDLTQRSLRLNRRALSHYSKNVQLFVFYHECGHTKVGANELAADCWAINHGVSEGWLTEADLGPICASWQGNPETPTHPSAARRCKQINKCFKSITAQTKPVPKKDTPDVDGNYYGFKPEDK